MASQIKGKLVKNFYDAILCNAGNVKFNDFVGGFSLFRNTANKIIWKVPLPLESGTSLSSDIFCDSQKELLENKTVKSININNCFKPFVQVELDIKHFIKDVLESDPTKIYYENSPKKIIVEFSSPNIAKPFHMGHLRSTIIGNSLANIKKKFGHDVIKMNYLGDWGTQFGIIQLGVNLEKYSEEDLKKNPLKLLLKAYVRGNAEAELHLNLYEEAKKIFHDLESGKEEITQMWMKYKKWTEDELNYVYDRLGISFDEYTWESDCNKEKACNILKMLDEKGILLEDKNGRKVAVIEEEQIPLLKSDETTLYLLRDLVAAIERRKKHSFDEMYYVVENGQTNHFQNLFKLCSELKINENVHLEHVKFGRVKGMSTRKGSVVLLSDVLNEARDRVYEKQSNSENTKIPLEMKNIADILGVSAVIINDLSHKRLRDYDFSWDSVIKLKGDTGVCLQYCHCRLCNLLIENENMVASECDPDAFTEPEALDLILAIARYEEILHNFHKNLEPCVLVKYMFILSGAINLAYKKLNVKYSDTHLKSQRLLLFNKSREVLNESMRLVGMKPLDKM